MTLHANAIRRIQATKKLDGVITLDMVGTERREHSRVPGRFNNAENAAYTILRKITKTLYRVEHPVIAILNHNRGV